MNRLPQLSVVLAITTLVTVTLSNFLVERREGSLRARLDELRATNAEHKAIHEQALAQLALRKTEIEQLREATSELPRLRGEFDRLKRKAAEIESLKANNQLLQEKLLQERMLALQKPNNPMTLPAPVSPGKMITRETLAYAGYDSPEAARQTAAWIQFTGRFDESTNALAGALSGALAGDPAQRIAFELLSANMARYFQGMQVLARKDIDVNLVELKVRTLFEPMAATSSLGIPSDISISRLIREGDAWRITVGDDTTKNVEEWDANGRVVRYAE